MPEKNISDWIKSSLTINAAMREALVDIKRLLADRRAREDKHNPRWREQPRAPRGTTDGGRWVDEGGGTSKQAALREATPPADNSRMAPPPLVAQILRGPNASWFFKPSDFGPNSGLDGSDLLVPDLPNMIAREDWAQFTPDFVDLVRQRQSIRDVEEIILHHTGNETTPEAVERLHRFNDDEWRALRDRGALQSYLYADVGYHYMIAADGTIYEGRNIYFQGAHVQGHNHNSIGIAFMGNFSSDSLTPAAIASVRNLMQALNTLAGRRLRVTTHGEHDARKERELAGALEQIHRLGQD